MEEQKTYKKTLQGVVVSDKMDKTAVAMVTTDKKHPMYHKYISTRKKFKFHDEQNKCKVGDIVKIVECRPLSKDKHFRLLEIIESQKHE